MNETPAARQGFRVGAVTVVTRLAKALTGQR